MKIKVLGSGAGGGLPQWNCNGQNSSDARHGHPQIKPRSQSSIAVTADGENWMLLNASPDLRQQIFDTKELHPHPDKGVRNSPIQAVFLTNADVDHITGLLCLREGHSFNLYGSDRVLSTLSRNSVFNVLNRDKVKRFTTELNQPIMIKRPSEGEGSGQVSMNLEITAFPVPGKVALFLEDESKGENFGTEEGDTIGLQVRDTNLDKTFFYIPGCADLNDELIGRIKDAELIFFDGTLFTNTEMLDQGLLPKTGERMGHMNMSGDNGSLSRFADLGIKRKIFIHINNSNPALREDSNERTIVENAGWEISFDGMEVNL